MYSSWLRLGTPVHFLLVQLYNQLYIRSHLLTCVGNMITPPHEESSDTYLWQDQKSKTLAVKLNLNMNWQ